ncbi:hypothetical protein ACMATS_06110 [Streptoverticillium reticulum]|uniref:hypothetical protein n=1 Tax=Streptoverticillium reticulum TaxID=1433415 RepID=UPI0039BF0B89
MPTSHRIAVWPRTRCLVCQREVAVMPCGRLTRHDAPNDKGLRHWGLISCFGSLRPARREDVVQGELFKTEPQQAELFVV